MINSIVENQPNNGNIITHLKKDIITHLNHFLNMLTKVKKRKHRKNNKKFGCNFYFIFRPNFNGTSKNLA
jgi:hypothetical protein